MWTMQTTVVQEIFFVFIRAYSLSFGPIP